MAELIPFEYRLRVAQKRQISRWVSLGVLFTLLSTVSVTYAFLWEHKRAVEHDRVSLLAAAKQTLIIHSHELRDRRQQLAGRMEKIQELIDDKVLLSLLGNISDGFSTQDCLEYVSIDARIQDKNAPPNKPAPDPKYVVRITGITENSGTLAELMTRLGHQSGPPISVVLESSHREALLDGQVMRFQIICEKADPKGT